MEVIKMEKKQHFLTGIIIIALIGIIILVVYFVYEMKKGNDSSIEQDNNQLSEIQELDEEKAEEKVEKEIEEEKIVEPEKKQEEYIGEEEKNVTDEETKAANESKSKDEKAIELAKKQWGDDNTVTFSIEEKKGSMFYIAVKSEANVISWYEVNTETWEINDY